MLGIKRSSEVQEYRSEESGIIGVQECGSYRSSGGFLLGVQEYRSSGVQTNVLLYASSTIV